jgi:WhiB family transcriptional regulator, redox-sensing transcriptional regulator
VEAEYAMTVALTRPTWELDAACRGDKSSTFMPPVGREATDKRQLRETAAKAVCVRCPVRDECLAYALRVDEPIGIWGGLNESERRELVAGLGREQRSA